MSDALEQLERSILLTNDDVSHQQLSVFDRHPRLYQYLLACVSLLAYVFIFSLPVLAILLTALVPDQIINAVDYMGVSLIFLEIAIALLAASLSIALYQLKISLPAGRPVTAEESPKLFTLINELNIDLSIHKLQPKIHQVKLSQHYEIRIVRTPKNGFPVLFTNTLILGLPLLQTHSPKHLKTLVGREILHLAGTNSRLSSWLIFANSYWQQYTTALKKQVKTPNVLLLLFFAWYAPLHKLISNGSIIIEHYFLDKKITDKLGAQNTIDTLVQNFISDKFLREIFWPQLNNKAYRHKTPPYLPYSSIEKALSKQLDDLTRQSWLDEAMHEKLKHSNRLSLINRLLNLDIKQANLPLHYKTSAANYFLNTRLNTLIQQMDRVWSASSKFSWQKKYRKGQKELSQLKELSKQSEQGILSDERIREYMKLIRRYLSDKEIMVLYRKILKLDTQDPRISFDIGNILLDNLQSDGVIALEKALTLDSDYTLTVCQLLTRYYSRIGDNRAAQSCRRRALAYQVSAA